MIFHQTFSLSFLIKYRQKYTNITNTKQIVRPKKEWSYVYKSQLLMAYNKIIRRLRRTSIDAASPNRECHVLFIG